MNNKKMIVVDLDGTLLNINGSCSDKTKRYLKRLKDLGYIIVIATGRFLRSAVSVTDGAEFANYIIANAGGLIYDMDKSRIVKKYIIDLSLVKKVCDNCDYNEIEFINICDVLYNNRYMDNGKFNISLDKKINNIDTFLKDSDDIFSISVHPKSNDLIEKYYEIFKHKNLDILVMQDSYSDVQCLEVFAKGVSKYNAIKVISELEGISNDNVIAFGDGLNDVDMIKLSGIGVAMGNALEKVKEVSNYITISHNNEGVIYFLEEYLKENNLSV